MSNAMSDIADALRKEGANLKETPWGPVAVDFGDWEAEYFAFRQGAGVFHPPSTAQVEIGGRQRAEFLNRLATNKLDDIQPGEGRETFLADANGRVLFHVFVFAGPDSLVLHTAAGQGPALSSHLDHYWIRENLKISDRSDEWGQLVLAGPHASRIVSELTNAEATTLLPLSQKARGAIYRTSICPRTAARSWCGDFKSKAFKAFISRATRQR